MVKNSFNSHLYTTEHKPKFYEAINHSDQKKPFSFIDQMVSCFKSEAFQTKLKISWLAAHYLEDVLSRFLLMLVSRTFRPVQPIQHQSMHEFRA